MRTAKSCGPGASTPASSSIEATLSATETNQPDLRGEHEVSRKTIAWGMPGVTGVTCMLVCAFYPILHTRPWGASSARHSLRPLSGARRQESGKARANSMRRECEGVRAPLPPRALARGGEGSGVGGGAASTEAAVPADRPPPPTPKSELRSSRPPPLRGGGERAKHAARNAELCFAVIASAAKQSTSPLARAMDCFASLAMTLMGCLKIWIRSPGGAKRNPGSTPRWNPGFRFASSGLRGAALFGRRLIGGRVVAAGEQSQRQSADRQNRDQLLDADGADHLEARGDHHGIGQRAYARPISSALAARASTWLLAHRM